MAYALHLLACGLVFLSSPGVVAGEEVERSLGASRHQIALVDLSDEQSQVVTRSVALYRDAGLVLPPLMVSGSRDDASCGGRSGLHRRTALGSEIMLCSSRADDWFRRVVLHELAHAWSEVGLTVERREAFRELRGWEHWLNYELAEWRDNGAEQAAEVIAWGVSDKAAPTVQIADDSCPELRSGYVALTGVEPLNGLTLLCGPPSRRLVVW